MALSALVDIAAFQTGIAASGAYGIAVAIAAGMAVIAEAVRTFRTDIAAFYAYVGAVRTIITGFALSFVLTFKTALAAARAGSSTVAVSTGIAAEAPAVRSTFHTYFAAAAAQQNTVFTGIALPALSGTPARLAGVVAIRAGSSAVAVAAGITAVAPSLITIVADILTLIAKMGAVITGKAFTALHDIITFAAGRAAAGTSCAAVAVGAGSAITAEFSLIHAVGAGCFTALADVINTVLAVEAFSALLFLFAFAAGLVTAGAD